MYACMHVYMQALWRARVEKQNFKAIMKGVKMQRVCEDEYLNQVSACERV